MKVLFISKYYYPHIGGVERHVHEISEQLINKNIKVSIITEKYNAELHDRTNNNGLEIIRISYPKIKFLGLIVIWLKMLCHIKEFISADVVHIHDVFIWFLPLKLIFPFKPVFITFHGYEDYPLKQKYLIIRHISKKLSRGNICIGRFIEKWYKIKSDLITYGAVNVELFNKNKSDKFVYDSIFIGRIDKHTGIDTYIKAAEILGKKSGFSLIVIGDGVNKKISGKNIIFLGSINNVEDYLSKARFIFVSRYLSILEAFASKKLVFSVYDNPLKEDYLRMTPFSKWLIICKNSEDLVLKVNYYLNNPSAVDNIVNEAFDWVSKYSWTLLTEQYLRLWDSKKFKT
ncbi:glycosyltransferase family 4 protein [Patescibacteria group bacterium]|nr:glycosyltransferase family 4 protein [Patescibacteria group bacterium]MBU2035979.1 glycosyltransferase family 4 protein [Patescibacteria group bacterium]